MTEPLRNSIVKNTTSGRVKSVGTAEEYVNTIKNLKTKKLNKEISSANCLLWTVLGNYEMVTCRRSLDVKYSKARQLFKIVLVRDSDLIFSIYFPVRITYFALLVKNDDHSTHIPFIGIPQDEDGVVTFINPIPMCNFVFSSFEIYFDFNKSDFQIELKTLNNMVAPVITHGVLVPTIREKITETCWDPIDILDKTMLEHYVVDTNLKVNLVLKANLV